jgi:hypothetical protein
MVRAADGKRWKGGPVGEKAEDIPSCEEAIIARRPMQKCRSMMNRTRVLGRGKLKNYEQMTVVLLLLTIDDD